LIPRGSWLFASFQPHHLNYYWRRISSVVSSALAETIGFPFSQQHAETTGNSTASQPCEPRYRPVPSAWDQRHNIA